jgi:hypothetical protein
MPVGDQLVSALGYGALFVETALWILHSFAFQDKEEVALAARGAGALAAVLLTVGLALRGLQVGYWPFHTAFELLVVGLLGLVLASLALLSARRHRPALLVLSTLASLVAVYALLVGRGAEPAILVHDSVWRIAYAALGGLGGGAVVVTGVAGFVLMRAEDGRAATERALAWGLLALSTGLASGAWWFQRLSGRYWGDARWASVVVVWLLTIAAWHGRREWLGRGWRAVVTGIVLGLAGSYVVLGFGGAA